MIMVEPHSSRAPFQAQTGAGLRKSEKMRKTSLFILISNRRKERVRKTENAGNKFIAYSKRR
jgi:superfamily II DNA or RNA helicase